MTGQQCIDKTGQNINTKCDRGVMNSPEQLRQAVDDYQRTLFGEWNWGGPSRVHPRSQGRLAKHADDPVEQRDMPVAVS